MKKTAEVIIIGAGIIGTSIAYHLAKLGCRDVVILEKEDDIGTGATAKANGGVRQEFNQEINIKLSLESVELFKRFEEETGYPSDFNQSGYLRFVSTEEELEELKLRVVLQQQLGVPVSLISPDEAKELIPALNVTDILDFSSTSFTNCIAFLGSSSKFLTLRHSGKIQSSFVSAA